MIRSHTGSPRENHILARLSPATIDGLLHKLEFVWLTSGELLHDSGKRQEFAYFPTTSVVALVHVTEQAESTLVAMTGCEGVVGVVQVLGDDSVPLRALVQSAGRAWRIKSQDFKAAFMRDVALMEQSLAYTQLLMTQMAQLVLCNRHHRLEQQLCRWLLSSLDRIPSNEIACTQELIASLLGVRRQGVAEAAAQLQVDGVIDRSRGLITVLSRERLEQKACECYRSIKLEQDRLFTRLLPGSPTRTERRQTGESEVNPLQRSQRLEMALIGSEMAWWDMYFLVNRPLVHYSRHWHVILGFHQEDTDLVSVNWDDQLHPDDVAAREAAMNAYLRNETDLFESEHRVRHKQGHWVWFAVRGKVAQRDSSGQPMRLLGTAMDISARKQNELTMVSLVNTDYLTGTASRRHFFEVAEKEFARALRYRSSLSLLALDLDHFKGINDQYGHSGGDIVLKAAVDTVRKFLRGADIFGRTGGEEFCVLLPETDGQGASALAQRILQAVRQSPAVLELGVAHYSISIGIANLLPRMNTFESLMKSADQALYRAKGLGRDRAELAMGDSEIDAPPSPI